MRLLVPIDLSVVSERVVDAAASLARVYDADLWLLHVTDPDPGELRRAEAPPAARDEMAHEHRADHRALQALARGLREQGLRATALMVQGPIDLCILREAKQLNADMIVMATHGHGAMFDLFVGSVSRAILQVSRIPVLMVPGR